jgi:hypothetical protein
MTFGVKHRFLEYNRLPISQVRNTDKPYLRSFTDVREALPISAINLVRLTPQYLPIHLNSWYRYHGQVDLFAKAACQSTISRLYGH